MAREVLFVVDASDSMNSLFGGAEDTTKFVALTRAFEMFFNTTSAKQKEQTERIRMGLFCYKTVMPPERTVFELVYPIRFFPPIPHIDDLRKIKPRGSSPTGEAIVYGLELLSRTPRNRKIMGVITGDCRSNFQMSIGDLPETVVPTALRYGINFSLLQVGFPKRSEFTELVDALQSVFIQNPFGGPKIAITVRQIRNWIEAVLERV